jgi:hypothetical protein
VLPNSDKYGHNYPYFLHHGFLLCGGSQKYWRDFKTDIISKPTLQHPYTNYTLEVAHKPRSVETTHIKLVFSSGSAFPQQAPPISSAFLSWESPCKNQILAESSLFEEGLFELAPHPLPG